MTALMAEANMTRPSSSSAWTNQKAPTAKTTVISAVLTYNDVGTR